MSIRKKTDPATTFDHIDFAGLEQRVVAGMTGKDRLYVSDVRVSFADFYGPGEPAKGKGTFSATFTAADDATSEFADQILRTAEAARAFRDIERKMQRMFEEAILRDFVIRRAKPDIITDPEDTRGHNAKDITP